MRPSTHFGRLPSSSLECASRASARTIVKAHHSAPLITVNPKVLDVARQLDVERKNKGRQSPLHGIPVVLKDNINTADMPTTAGSISLEGFCPPQATPS